MLKTFNVLLDTVQATNNPSFSVNTNDLKTLQFNITIQQNEVPLDLSNATVKLAVKKPDNKTTFQDVTVVYGPSGTCQVTLDTQSYMVPGYHKAEAMIYNGTDVVAVTSYFSYTATKGILDDTTIESTTEFQAINQIVSDAENIKSDAQASADSAAASATLAQNTVNEKADKTYVDTQLSSKANQTSLDTTNATVGNKADKTYVDTQLGTKANQSSLDTTNANVAANTSSLADSATDLNLSGTKLQLKKADGSLKGTGIDIPTVGLDDTSTSTSKTWSSSKINTTLSTINASPRGVYATFPSLQTAFPTGNTNIYLVTGNIVEVDTLNVTASPTTSGNVTVTLNGVATNIAVTIGTAEVDTLTVSAGATSSANITITLNGVATNVAVASGDTAGAIGDKIRATTFTGWTVGGTAGTATVTFTKTTVGTNTTPTYSAGTTGATGSFAVTTAGVNADTTTTVATKIRGVAFSGWTTGGSGTSVTFTKTTAGTNTTPAYSAGTTGTTGTMSVTTAGANADGNWYYWNGSAWTAGGLYQSSSWQEGIDARTNTLGMVYPNLKSRIDDLAGVIQNSVSTLPTFTDIADGAIDDTTGQDITNGRKKRTSGLHYIPSGRILTITVPTTYYMSVYAYNSNNVSDFAAKVVDSKQGTIVYTTAYNYYRFSFVRADSNFFTDNTFINTITFTIDFTNAEIKTARGAYSSLSDRFNSLSAENTLSNAFKYGLQLFTSSMNVAGTWINPTGAFVANASYKYAKIPVVAGETVSITRNDNGAKSFFASNTGAIAFIDTNGNILSSVSPENYFNGAYNNSSIVTVTIPANTAYLGLTTVLGATWDITTTLIVVYGDTITSTLLAAGEIGKLYNYPLKDTTARALIKNLPVLSTNGKKWVYVGDSITENNSYATSHYWSYIQTDLGFTGINMGASGTGYKRSEDTNVAFYQRIGSIDTTADVVTIFGSINDAYYGTYGTLGTANDVFTVGADNTVCACINKTLDTLYSVMPLVKVGLITPLPNFNAYPGLTTIWFESYVNAIVQIGKQRGIPVLDLYHRSLLKPWDATQNSLFYENDITKNTHPNANGHKVFYPAIREFLKSLI